MGAVAVTVAGRDRHHPLRGVCVHGLHEAVADARADHTPAQYGYRLGCDQPWRRQRQRHAFAVVGLQPSGSGATSGGAEVTVTVSSLAMDFSTASMMSSTW